MGEQEVDQVGGMWGGEEEAKVGWGGEGVERGTGAEKQRIACLTTAAN